MIVAPCCRTFRKYLMTLNIVFWWQAWKESNPLWRGFGDRRSSGELHAWVGTNWRTRTALTRSTAVRHHLIGLVGIDLVARPRAARGARPL